jgi:isopentenyl diphosphate isomerase/L-lactate dehydrogenase-like FMN-dependent dehydrogenase
VRDVLNTDEMRTRARRLPKAIFDVIDGGASDEITLRANRSAFDSIWLRPRALADVSNRTMSTAVLGETITMPLMLAPCGFARMANSEAELAVARAAGRAGTVFAVSGSASYSLEQIASAGSGPLWYQPPLSSDGKVSEAVLGRAEAAGYGVLCILIDTAVNPKRERDYRNHLSIPLEISPRLLLTGITNPLWTKDFILGRVGHRGIAPGIGGARTAYWNLARTVRNMRPITFKDIAWLREHWKGKLVLKGVTRGDECSRMVDAGVDGIIVSNHGGRNLDCIRPTIEILPEVVRAVHGRAEVFLDGGVRRGTDVIKALALGARACLVGRPYLFGLAAGGEAGVARILEIFRNEIDHTMALTGCATVSDITSDLVTASS